MNLSRIHRINGAWLPKSDTEIARLITNGIYIQIRTMHTALQYVKKFRTCLDIGGHCGLWAMHLIKRFETLHSFEPVPIHRDCWNLNVKGKTLHPFALGNEEKEIRVKCEKTNTGNSHVDENGDIDASQKRLDDLDYKDVDFIKIDVEGYEKFVIEGGLELIKRDRPVICLEQKPHGFYDIPQLAGVELLKDHGYEVVDKVRDDWIMV